MLGSLNNNGASCIVCKEVPLDRLSSPRFNNHKSINIPASIFLRSYRTAPGADRIVVRSEVCTWKPVTGAERARKDQRNMEKEDGDDIKECKFCAIK